MIYQVKIDQAVLFTGNLPSTLDFLSNYKRYPLSWLMVYGYDLGEQKTDYRETAESFIK